LKEQLKRHFIIDREELPDRYKAWFALPWHKIYTLNVDDGDDAVAEKDAGARLQILSALNSKPGDIRSNLLPVVHINGRLQDFPELTFGPWEFASRTASSDPWYFEFTSDIATRPVVVIGSVLDEPPLWHYLTLREHRGNNKELRPRSWIVSPRLDIGRKSMLEQLNFKHVELTEAEFYDSVVADHAADLTALRQRETTTSPDSLLDVAAEIRVAAEGTPEFLLGATPTWGDVTNGYAATFAFDDELMQSISSRDSGTISVIGSAGSGKTTSLMRAAAVLAAQNNSVLWLGRETELPMPALRREVEARKPDYLFIDDVDRFGSDVAVLLRGLQRASSALVVIVGTRSSRFYALRFNDLLTLSVQLEQAKLTNEDAEALLVQLDRGHRLGALVGMSHADRVRTIVKRDDRQHPVSASTAE
jgi:hypothetical protein